MEKIKDFSFGVIPFKKEGNNFLFLLIRHWHKHGGHWAFPKGHREQGESDIETALRELEEEIGIKEVKIIEGPNFFERYSFEQDSARYDKEVKYFLGEVLSGNPTPRIGEIEDFVWLPYNEATKKITFVEGKKMLEEAYKFLKFI